MRLFFALSEDKRDLYIFASLECILILSRILVYSNLTSTKTNTSLYIAFKIVVNVIARTSEIFGNKSPLFSNTKTMTFTNVQAAGLEYQLLFCLLDYLSYFALRSVVVYQSLYFIYVFCLYANIFKDTPPFLRISI